MDSYCVLHNLCPWCLNKYDHGWWSGSLNSYQSQIKPSHQEHKVKSLYPEADDSGGGEWNQEHSDGRWRKQAMSDGSDKITILVLHKWENLY